MTTRPLPLGKQEVASLLGYPRSTVYTWAKRGKLPPPDGTASGVDLWWLETIMSSPLWERRREPSAGRRAKVGAA